MIWAPGLPASLNLDPVTGDITGTPNAPAAAAAYTVTARNGARTAAAPLTIDVLAAPFPDATIDMPAAVHPNDPHLEARVPHRPGLTYLWRITASTSTAAITAGANTATATLNTGNREGTFRLEVNVQNGLGVNRTSHRDIRVESGIWVRKDPVGTAEPNAARVSATLLPGGRGVLVVGGQFPLPRAVVRTMVAAAIYDPATNRWAASALGQIPMLRADRPMASSRL